SWFAPRTVRSRSMLGVAQSFATFVSQDSSESQRPVTSDARSDPTSSRCQISRDRTQLWSFATVAELFFDGRAYDPALHARMVEPDGIEPTTSCLQSRRSPN